MVKIVKLTLGERQLVYNLLSQLENLQGDIPYKVRTITREFKLEEAKAEIEAWSHDRFAPYREALALYKKDPSLFENEPEAPKPISWLELQRSEKLKVEIDGIYLSWLSGLLEAKDWTTRVLPDGRKTFLQLSVDHICTIADLQDALRQAEEISHEG